MCACVCACCVRAHVWSGVGGCAEQCGRACCAMHSLAGALHMLQMLLWFWLARGYAAHGARHARGSSSLFSSYPKCVQGCCGQVGAGAAQPLRPHCLSKCATCAMPSVCLSCVGLRAAAARVGGAGGGSSGPGSRASSLMEQTAGHGDKMCDTDLPCTIMDNTTGCAHCGAEHGPSACALMHCPLDPAVLRARTTGSPPGNPRTPRRARKGQEKSTSWCCR